jgi:ABC-type amino acid transport substrate-binding protein
MVRRFVPARFRVAAAALAFGLSSIAGAARAADALRVCADPDNLPFSANRGAERGLYVELAELVGRKLDLPVAYTWYYTHYQRRAMRNTILAGDCDAMFALPANADYRHRGVHKSRPFLEVGYALVSAPGVALSTIGSLESLKGKRVALQFQSTPHILFSTLDGYTTATYKEPEEVFAALARGEADVGILWGPVAGYENKTKHQGRWQVTPVTGHDLSGQVVVGVRAGNEALKARIDQALSELQPQIRELAAKYGFPNAAPVSLEARKGSAAPTAGAALARVSMPASWWRPVNEGKPAAAASAPARRSASAAAAKPPAKRAAPTTAAAATPVAAAAPALDPVAQAGRVRFNDQCSHCHGSDGATPIRERDVRRLSMRYDADKWQNVAQTTIRNGRTDAGMPSWKDALGDKEIKELLAFLAAIQK